MDRGTLLLAVAIAVGIPSFAYLISTRYTVSSPQQLPAVIIVDGWTGKAELATGL